MGTGRTISAHSQTKRDQKTNDLELRPDGWERFKRAVSAAAKSGPKHRPTQAGKGRATKKDHVDAKRYPVRATVHHI
jgi:hypothetical protein